MNIVITYLVPSFIVTLIIYFIYILSRKKTKTYIEEIDSDKIYRRVWDTSNKEYEVLNLYYQYDKVTRKRINIPRWRHYKYYKTLKSAKDAARDLRRLGYHNHTVEYPPKWRQSNFNYGDAKPRLTVYRFKAVRRDDKPLQNVETLK